MDELIELRALPRAEANVIFDRLVAIDRLIFRHASEEQAERFYQGMRDLSVAQKWAVLYRAGGEIVGFNLIKIQPFEVEGRTVWAVGSVAGFLPGHIGGNRTMPDAIRAMMRVKLRHPERQFYFVSMLINPGGYDMLVDLCPATYPSPLRNRPQRFEAALIEAAARASGADILVNEPPRVIVSVGRAGRDPFDHRRETENTRYFEALNPRYADGELLGVCMPLGFDHLARGALRLVERRARKRLGLRR
jgi:hypothetical protein